MTYHLLDLKRGRANIRCAWTACGKAARSCFVLRHLELVTCAACFRAKRIKDADALCDCYHARRFHAGGKGTCSKCAVRKLTGSYVRDCDRFKALKEKPE